MDLNIVILLIKTAYYKILNQQILNSYWLILRGRSYSLLQSVQSVDGQKGAWIPCGGIRVDFFGEILKSIFELFAVKSTQLFLNKRIGLND